MKQYWTVILCAFCLNWTGITEALAQKVLHSIVKEARKEDGGYRIRPRRRGECYFRMFL